MLVTLLFVGVCAETDAQLRSDEWRSVAVDSDGAMYDNQRHAPARRLLAAPDRLATHADGRVSYSVHSLLDYRHRAHPESQERDGSRHMALGRSHLHSLVPHNERRERAQPAAPAERSSDVQAEPVHQFHYADDKAVSYAEGTQAEATTWHSKHGIAAPTRAEANQDWMLSLCTSGYVYLNNPGIDSGVIHGTSMSCTVPKSFGGWDADYGQMLSQVKAGNGPIASGAAGAAIDEPTEMFAEIEQEASSTGTNKDILFGHPPARSTVGPKVVALFYPHTNADDIEEVHDGDANVRKLQCLVLTRQQLHTLWETSDSKGAYGVFLNEAAGRKVGHWLPCLVVTRTDTVIKLHVAGHATTQAEQDAYNHNVATHGAVGQEVTSSNAGIDHFSHDTGPVSTESPTPVPTPATTTTTTTTTTTAAATPAATSSTTTTTTTTTTSAATPAATSSTTTTSTTSSSSVDTAGLTTGSASRRRAEPIQGTTESTTWVTVDSVPTAAQPRHHSLYQQLFGPAIQFPSLAAANRERAQALDDREQREEERERKFAAEEAAQAQRERDAPRGATSEEERDDEPRRDDGPHRHQRHEEDREDRDDDREEHRHQRRHRREEEREDRDDDRERERERARAPDRDRDRRDHGDRDERSDRDEGAGAENYWGEIDSELARNRRD